MRRPLQVAASLYFSLRLQTRVDPPATRPTTTPEVKVPQGRMERGTASWKK
jgi:hypothetical protein